MAIKYAKDEEEDGGVKINYIDINDEDDGDMNGEDDDMNNTNNKLWSL